VKSFNSSSNEEDSDLCSRTVSDYSDNLSLRLYPAKITRSSTCQIPHSPESTNFKNKLSIKMNTGKVSSSNASFLFSPMSFISQDTLSNFSYRPPPMTEVLHQKLYIGSEDDARNKSGLLDLGITHVLSVNDHVFPVPGIKHKHFPMHDSGRTDLDGVLRRVYPFILESQQDGKKLFVHCMLGQNRSATVVLAVLMKTEGLNLFEAFKLLKNKRPIVQINEV